jgi:hypothetical protein
MLLRREKCYYIHIGLWQRDVWNCNVHSSGIIMSLLVRLVTDKQLDGGRSLYRCYKNFNSPACKTYFERHNLSASFARLWWPAETLIK